ncbi:GAF domain-containing sensor histidine kinase [Micromonosporaceae bacterium Da 78-11]
MSARNSAAVLSEQQRIAAVHAYRVLDTPPESDFDDIAQLAAQLCRTPIALVSLVDTDRQWFKAKVGLDVCETPRDTSFCAHAMWDDDVMQVPDARVDPRFADNPLVLGDPNIRFYAGAPLVTPAGVPLGSLCVIDTVPRVLTPAEVHGLTTLARHVVVQLELRQYARDVQALNERLRSADRLKDEFIARVTHELRTPLTSIHGYLEVLDDPELSPAANAQFVERIRRNSDRLMHLVDDMLLASQVNTDTIKLDRQPVDLADLASTATVQNRVLATAKGLTVTADATGPVPVVADGRRIAQVLDRLLLNAVKFTDHGGITVTATSSGTAAVLQVRDTGVGISAEDRLRVLSPFRRSAAAERDEVQGIGLGLAIVKAIVDAHGGDITIDSTVGVGTTVTVVLPGTAAPPG